MLRDRIFISYRRSDVPNIVGEIHRVLVKHFGEQAVFQDSEAICAGEKFPVRLNNELSRAAFVLAVIGPGWNGPEGTSGGLLEDPGDWVRMELLTALKDDDSNVIPLLIGDTKMPSRESLPKSIQALVDHNAVTLCAESIQHDIAPVVTQIVERISPIDGSDKGAPLRMAVREQLGSVVAAHVWNLWQHLLPQLEKPIFSFNQPAGFCEGDIRELHRTLQWLVDVAERDAGWWRDVSILVMVDAVVWVASDIMDRLTPPDDSNNNYENAMDSMHERRRKVIMRLAELANQQDSIEDQTGASNTRNFLKYLYTLEDVPPSYIVALDSYTSLKDDVELIVERPYGFMRTEVSWIVDYLRPDSVEVDNFGEPIGVGVPQASMYRWGRLLQSSDDSNTVWESRYLPNSWFRRALQRARDEYPTGLLAQLIKGQST